jgi:membrane protein YqaA with SNARE-associated domain
MLRRLYNWCVDTAGKPHTSWILGCVAFAESSFFPAPPDVMLIPMALARPDRAWYFATVCTLASVAGGLLGYFIGSELYATVGQWLIKLYGYGDKVDAFRDAYLQYGALIILLKGLTPIPYKIVTITSGFAGFSIGLFLVLSLITRGARFFFIAFLLNRYGDRARDIIEKRLGLWAGLSAALIVVGFIVVVRVF